MAEIAGKMICPRCRVEMNYHADKLVYGASPQAANSVEVESAGFIEEFHTCPNCGTGAWRAGPVGLSVSSGGERSLFRVD